MPTNFYMYFVAAFIPPFIGFFYYNKAALGSTWSKVHGFADTDMKVVDLAFVLLFTYLLSLLLTIILGTVVIHQSGTYSMMLPEAFQPGSTAKQQFNDLMAQYGHKYRSFAHGALHGAVISVMFIFPILAINAMFEKKGWKYILVHAGFWLICTVLMGGILCANLEYAYL